MSDRRIVILATVDEVSPGCVKLKLTPSACGEMPLVVDSEERVEVEFPGGDDPDLGRVFGTVFGEDILCGDSGRRTNDRDVFCRAGLAGCKRCGMMLAAKDAP